MCKNVSTMDSRGRKGELFLLLIHSLPELCQILPTPQQWVMFKPILWNRTAGDLQKYAKEPILCGPLSEIEVALTHRIMSELLAFCCGSECPKLDVNISFSFS